MEGSIAIKINAQSIGKKNISLNKNIKTHLKLNRSLKH